MLNLQVSHERLVGGCGVVVLEDLVAYGTHFIREHLTLMATNRDQLMLLLLLLLLNMMMTR